MASKTDADKHPRINLTSVDLQKKIQDMVTKLNSEKAPKKKLDPAMKELLTLKAKFKALTGEDWKTEIPGPAPADNTKLPGPAPADNTKLPGPAPADNTKLPGPAPADNTKLPGPAPADNTKLPGPAPADNTKLPGPESKTNKGPKTTSMKVKILNLMKMTEEGKKISTAITDSGQIRRIVSIHPQELMKDCFYLITNFINYETCSFITNNSMIMTTCPFEVDEDAINQYMTPETLTFAQARSSPNKRRLTICGQVTNVSGDIPGRKSIRRQIVLKDHDTPHTIPVLFWNSNTTRPDFPNINDNVKITGAQVAYFNSKFQLKVEDDSSIQTMQEEDTVRGKVEGVCFDHDREAIFINGQNLRLSTQQVYTLFPNGIMEPLEIVAHTINGHVVSLERLPEHILENPHHKDEDLPQ